MNTQALIVEPPKVELLPAMVIEPPPIDVRGMMMTLEIHDPRNGRHWSFPAQGFESWAEQEMVDVTSIHDSGNHRRYRPSFVDRRWTAWGGMR